MVNANGEVLLVQQKEGSFVFPKGKIEDGETPLDAAEREVGEETGIGKEDLKRLKDFPVYQRPQLVNKEIIQRIHMFLFVTGKSDVCPIPEFRDEISGTRWAANDEAPGLLSAPEDKEFFCACCQKSKKRCGK